MLSGRNTRLKGVRLQEFSDSVHEHLRGAGYFQKDLAKELGLHPKVLSRKLSDNGDASLTQEEVWRIISTLAQWNAIITQDEAFHLLRLAQVDPHSIGIHEWQKPPLNQLAGTRNLYADYTYLPTLKHNLPAPLHRFIGREKAAEQLRHLLGQDEVRLVTLVGPGGSGKTRLALHVANDLLDSFAQGIWFVYLAGVRDYTLVPQNIMQALNIKPVSSIPAVQRLISYLQDKQLLLILDNFEHVGDASTGVSELLTAVPGLKVLITSRVVLRLYGEYEFKVLPLDFPASGAVLDVTKIAQYDAVQLFVERARAVISDFSLTAENAGNIAQICARVDGLPLALELAAARIKVLPPELLVAKLSEARLSVLKREARNLPGRHQALRNTITWSHDLLSPDEQVWFARLGIFTGWWSLEATESLVQAVVASQQQEHASLSLSALDLLEQMVDNSLLIRLLTTAGHVRFLLLETLREYALEQLEARGELDYLRNWHACYYLKLVEGGERGLKGPKQLGWHALLVAEQDNIRAALAWSLQRAEANEMIGDPPLAAVEVALRMVAALRSYWEWDGSLLEGRNWFDQALALPLAEEMGRTVHVARAKALGEGARLLSLQNEQDKAAVLAEESIALWQGLDDPEGLATALLYRGWAAHALGDYTLAISVYEQGRQLLSSTGDVWLRAQLLFYQGDAVGFTFDFEQMHSFHAQSKELFEQVGDRSALADMLKDQGGMTILEGNYAQAITNLVKSIEISHELGHKQFISTGVGLLAFAVGVREEPDPISATLQAAELWGIKEGMMDVIGSGSWLEEWSVAQAMQRQILARVDEAVWRRSWEAGRALSEEQVIGLCRKLQEA